MKKNKNKKSKYRQRKAHRNIALLKKGKHSSQKLARGTDLLAGNDPIAKAVREVDVPGERSSGIVIEGKGRHALADYGDKAVEYIAHRRLRDESETLFAPGDEVEAVYDEESQEKRIVRIAERRTRLSRLVQGRRALPFEQVIAANIELLVVVAAAAEPPFHYRLVDRYWVIGLRGGVDVALCINKMDLADRIPEKALMYKELGLPLIACSAKTEEGLSDLKALVRGKRVVFSGHSGVGKSTLLNAWDPDLDLETASVRRDGRGRHTTRYSRLIRFGDGYVIDTPGIRALSLGTVKMDEIGWYFPEFARFADECKYKNCRHDKEPECAIKAAVENGEIRSTRYNSYLRLMNELEE